MGIKYIILFKIDNSVHIVIVLVLWLIGVGVGVGESAKKHILQSSV